MMAWLVSGLLIGAQVGSLFSDLELEFFIGGDHKLVSDTIG
jgi:hypothetical protein